MSSQSGHGTSIRASRLGCRLPFEQGVGGDEHLPGEVKTYTLSPEELAKYGPVRKQKRGPTPVKITRELMVSELQRITIGQLAVKHHIDRGVMEKLAERYGIELDEKGRLADKGVADVNKEEQLMEKCSRERMKELIEQGTTNQELATLFDSNRSTVIRVKAKYGLAGLAKNGRPGKLQDKITREILADRLAKGMLLRQIADEFGCSAGTVHRLKELYGLSISEGDKDMQDFNEAVQACEAEPEPCEALDAMMDLVERMHKEIIKIRQALQNVTIEL
jgi:transposase